MSALSPSATWQMVSPVAGLVVAKVLPETLSSHLPPMSSGWSLTRGGLTACWRGAVAVVMANPPAESGEGSVMRWGDCRERHRQRSRRVGLGSVHYWWWGKALMRDLAGEMEEEELRQRAAEQERTPPPPAMGRR